MIHLHPSLAAPTSPIRRHTRLSARSEKFTIRAACRSLPISPTTSTESNECDRRTPVIIQDYATAEYVNLRTALNASTEPTTQRQGILTITEQGGMTVDGNGVYWLPQGFRFTFQELEARTA